MDEFRFVIKCFIFSCAIVLFSKSQFQGETIETHATRFLHQSDLAAYLRQTAEGGVRLIEKKSAQWRGDATELFGGNN